MARTSIATDDFNRGSLGANWDTTLNTTNGGSISIDSSIRVTGQFSSFGVDEYHADARWVGSGSFTNDHYSSLTLAASLGGLGANYLIGVIARASADTNASRDYYMVLVKDTSPTATILAKVVNGTYTQLGSTTSVSWASGDRIEIECEGTTIRACKNGTAIGGALTVTDASLSTGSPGIASNAALYGDDWDGGTVTAGDSTAPVLTSPTGTGSTLTSAGGVTTDEGNGTLYMVTTSSATAPTKAQVKAGQDHTGAAALRVSSAAVSSTGAKTFSAASCTAGTRYNHYMHEDAAANQSNVVSSTSFVVGSGVTFSGTVPAQSGVTSTSFSLDLSSYFSGNMSRTYAVQSGSLSGSGLTLNTSTAIVSGTLGTVGAYTISVRATDSYGDTDDTNSFTITISATGTAPSVSTHPTDLTVTSGASASFTAAASGSPTPTVQWYENTGSWNLISGQTSTTLSLGIVGTIDNGRVFRAVFTNSSGTATTTSATLTVNAATGDGTLTSEPLRRNNGSLVGATTLTWLGVRNDSTGADLLVMTSVTVNSSSIFTTGANAAFAIGQTYAVQWKESGGAHGQATVIAT